MSKQRRHVQFLDLLLLLIAALSHPLLVKLLSQYSQSLALFVPGLLFAVLLSLLRPDPFMPLLVIGAIYAVEIPTIAFGGGVHPSLVEQVYTQQQYHLLGIPVAGVAMGYAVVLTRRNQPLWRWRIKTNLRLLALHPVLFMRIYWFGLLVLLIGIVADGVTTIRTLLDFGPMAEVHPAMRTAVHAYGVVGGVVIGQVVRMCFVIFTAAIWRRWCTYLLTICGLLYVLAAFSNHYRWL